MLHRIRLDDTESDHFRLVSTRADSAAEALANALRQEDKTVAFRLSDAEANRLAAKGATPSGLSGKDRGRLHAHHQSARYAVTRINGEPVTQDLIAEADRILADRRALQAEMMVAPEQPATDEQEG